MSTDAMHCACGNFARYVNERSELCCALCPLRQNIQSWRILDVPGMILGFQARLLETHQQLAEARSQLDEANAQLDEWAALDAFVERSGG